MLLCWMPVPVLPSVSPGPPRLKLCVLVASAQNKLMAVFWPTCGIKASPSRLKPLVPCLGDPIFSLHYFCSLCLWYGIAAMLPYSHGNIWPYDSNLSPTNTAKVSPSHFRLLRHRGGAHALSRQCKLIYKFGAIGLAHYSSMSHAMPSWEMTSTRSWSGLYYFMTLTQQPSRATVSASGHSWGCLTARAGHWVAGNQRGFQTIHPLRSPVFYTVNNRHGGGGGGGTPHCSASLEGSLRSQLFLRQGLSWVNP